MRLKFLAAHQRKIVEYIFEYVEEEGDEEEESCLKSNGVVGVSSRNSLLLGD